jgi:hypothetical protein
LTIDPDELVTKCADASVLFSSYRVKKMNASANSQLLLKQRDSP